MTTNQTRVYVGTYTRNADSTSEGIYILNLNMDTGELMPSGIVDGIENPSFLVLDSNQQHLYAVSEVDDFGDKSSGAVVAYAINQETGNLTHLNQQPTNGAHPCYVSLDNTGQYVLVANYTGGSVCVFPVAADGSLGEASTFIQHEGSSVNPNRQEAAHAHSISTDPANRLVMVADLGLDKVMVYQLDLSNGKLTPHTAPSAPIHPGGGPRHFDFHPSRKYLYVLNELDSTLTAFTYNEVDGTLAEIHTIATVPDDFDGHDSCADIHVAATGRFVYSSNRGHHSIAIFAVDEATGSLTAIGHQSTQGKVPRNFGIDPTGTFLLAANQDTNNIAVLRIDQQTGELTPTGHEMSVPKPVCVKFMTN